MIRSMRATAGYAANLPALKGSTYDSIRIAVATARARRDPTHPRVIRNTRTGLYLSDATTATPIWGDQAQARIYHRSAEDEAMTYGARVVPLSVIDVEAAVYGHGR